MTTLLIEIWNMQKTSTPEATFSFLSMSLPGRLFVLAEILQPLNSKRKVLIGSDCSCTSATRNSSHHFLSLLQLRIQNFFEIEVLMFNFTCLERPYNADLISNNDYKVVGISLRSTLARCLLAWTIAPQRAQTSATFPKVSLRTQPKRPLRRSASDCLLVLVIG